MNASKKALQDINLSLRVYARLELIGVRTLEQLRVLVAMRDKTRSQTVRTLLRLVQGEMPSLMRWTAFCVLRPRDDRTSVRRRLRVLRRRIQTVAVRIPHFSRVGRSRPY